MSSPLSPPGMTPPILADKEFAAPSVFEPANLLREARRRRARRPLFPRSACSTRTAISCGCCGGNSGPRCRGLGLLSHRLYEFEQGAERCGIIGCAVGASFAVLLAEQLFVSGCRFLVSVTSAGQIVPQGPPPYFVVIDRALATKAPATIICRRRNSRRPTRHWSRLRSPRWQRPGCGSTRRGVDHRRPVPGNRGRDRTLPRPQHPRGRNGGRRRFMRLPGRGRLPTSARASWPPPGARKNCSSLGAAVLKSSRWQCRCPGSHGDRSPRSRSTRPSAHVRAVSGPHSV